VECADEQTADNLAKALQERFGKDIQLAP